MPEEHSPIIGYLRSGKPVYQMAGGDGTDGDGTETQTTTQSTETTTQEPEKKFSQADLDRIVQDRVARAKPADYDEIKARAAKLDELEAGQKSDLQKAVERAEKAERKLSETEAKANSILKRAAILAEAAQVASDPEIVVALLVSSEDITVSKDGEVEGVKEAVKELLKGKPILKKGSTGSSGGEFGGNNQMSIDEEIAKLTEKGDHEGAMRLKLAKAQGL